MIGRKQVLGLGLLFAVATSAPALAQTSASSYPVCSRQPTGDESKQAHDRYTAGKLHYDEGDYENAVKRFKEAYVLDCTKHDLLIIISAAYEKKGDRSEAIRALETYVQRVNNPVETQTYNAKIENLKKELAKQQQQAAASASSTPVAPPPPPAEERGHTVLPWIVVGIGGAAAITGAVIALTAPEIPPNCSAETGRCIQGAKTDAEFKKDQDKAGYAKDQPLVGGLIAAGGAVLVVGGLVWHFLEPTGGPKEASGKARVAPAVAPGYGGLAISGSF